MDPQRSFSAYLPCSLNELAFLPTHPCNLRAAILLNARQFPTVHGAEPGAIHYLAFEACSWPLSELEKGTPLGAQRDKETLCEEKVTPSSRWLGFQLPLTHLASIHYTWRPCRFYLITFIFFFSLTASLPSSLANWPTFLNKAGMFSLYPFLMPSPPHHPPCFQGFCQVSPRNIGIL